MIERFDQLLSGLAREWRPRDDAEGVCCLEPHSRILVVNRLEQRGDEGWRRGPGPERNRAEVEGGCCDRGLALLDHEPDHAAVLYFFSNEELKFRGNRLELNLVDRIHNQRRHRSNGLRIFRVAQEPHGAQAGLRIGVPKIAHNVVETKLLRGRGTCQKQRYRKKGYEAIECHWFAAGGADLFYRRSRRSAALSGCPPVRSRAKPCTRSNNQEPMKLSRRELLAAGAAVATARPARPEPPSVLQSSAPARELIRPRQPPNLPIRDYLVREARRITETALADMKTSAGFNRAVAEKRRRFVGMMGLDNAQAVKQHPPVLDETTGVVERANYRIEKLHYESLPNLHVTANLYLPKVEKAERRPAILYVCGHVEQQKVHYQGHPKRFAELGFPTLIVDTVQYGEAPGYHHGCYREGWFHWYSRGYSPAAIEVVNGIRGLDFSPPALRSTAIASGSRASRVAARQRGGSPPQTSASRPAHRSAARPRSKPISTIG